jgi:hypothetical protein
MKKPFARIGAVVFGIVAIAHLLRVIFHLPVIIGGYSVPMWMSVIAFLISGLLAVMLFRESEMESHV